MTYKEEREGGKILICYDSNNAKETAEGKWDENDKVKESGGEKWEENDVPVVV